MPDDNDTTTRRIPLDEIALDPPAPSNIDTVRNFYASLPHRLTALENSLGALESIDVRELLRSLVDERVEQVVERKLLELAGVAAAPFAAAPQYPSAEALAAAASPTADEIQAAARRAAREGRTYDPPALSDAMLHAMRAELGAALFGDLAMPVVPDRAFQELVPLGLLDPHSGARTRLGEIVAGRLEQR